MAITQANIFSESYNIIKTFLSNNITDPKGRYKANWVHASMPNINDKGFDGYPFIILKIDLTEDNKTFDIASEKIFRVQIQIRAYEATDVDTICDSIHNQFKTETKLTEFEAREISASPFVWTMDEKGRKVVFRTIDLILRSRI